MAVSGTAQSEPMTAMNKHTDPKPCDTGIHILPSGIHVLPSLVVTFVAFAVIGVGVGTTSTYAIRQVIFCAIINKARSATSQSPLTSRLRWVHLEDRACDPNWK
jgi:hypothetical protein